MPNDSTEQRATDAGFEGQAMQYMIGQTSRFSVGKTSHYVVHAYRSGPSCYGTGMHVQ